MMAVASRSQCGAPSPEKAGTRVTAGLSATDARDHQVGDLARREQIGGPGQGGAGGQDVAFPSEVGRSVSQARVVGTAEPPGTKASTGVITDDPVP